VSILDTVNWRQILREDFSGYANQAAFEAVYGVSALGVWGLTEGPDGQPGVSGRQTGVGLYTKPIAPSGRFFRVTARISATHARIMTAVSNSLAQFLLLQAGSTSNFSASPIHWTSSQPYPSPPGPLTDQTLLVRAGDLSTSGNWLTNVAFLTGSKYDLDIRGAFSTKTLSGGSYVANADGVVEVRMNGVLVDSFSGVVITGDVYWTRFSFNPPDGKLAALVLYDGSTAPGGLDQSVPCCATDGQPSGGVGGSTGSGTGTAGDTLGQNPFESFPPITDGCTAGGTFPASSAGEPSDAEDWAA